MKKYGKRKKSIELVAATTKTTKFLANPELSYKLCVCVVCKEKEQKSYG